MKIHRQILNQENAFFKHIQKAVVFLVLAAILAASFLAYLRPTFVVDLANRFILCN